MIKTIKKCILKWLILSFFGCIATTPIQSAWTLSFMRSTRTYAQNMYQSASHAIKNYTTSLQEDLEFEDDSLYSLAGDRHSLPANPDYPQEFEPGTDYSQQITPHQQITLSSIEHSEKLTSQPQAAPAYTSETTIPSTIDTAKYEDSPKSIIAQQQIITSCERKEHHERELVEIRVKKMLRNTGITPSKQEQCSLLLALPNEILYKILTLTGITWRVIQTIPFPYVNECVPLKMAPIFLAKDKINTLHIYNWQDNTLKRTLTVNRHSKGKFAVSSPETIAVISWSDITNHRSDITLYNLLSNTPIKTLEGHEHKITALTMLPHNMLASGSIDDTIKIWDLQSGECFKTLHGMVSSLVALPNGTLASGSHDGTINLWNTASGERIGILNEHTARISDLIILPNGTLASGSEDGTIKIWNSAARNCIKTFSFGNSIIIKLAATRSGTLIWQDNFNNIYCTNKHRTQMITNTNWRSNIITPLEDGSFLLSHVENIKRWKSLPDFGCHCQEAAQKSKRYKKRSTQPIKTRDRTENCYLSSKFYRACIRFVLVSNSLDTHLIGM